jgi:hypothetical protein
MNWNKVQNLSQAAANGIINASQNCIPGVVMQHGLDSWGLPLTGGMVMGFAIGFMKGQAAGKFITAKCSIQQRQR